MVKSDDQEVPPSCTSPLPTSPLLQQQTILCHNCLTPTPSNHLLPCPNNCSFHYCSPTCLENDQQHYPGGHHTSRCSLLKSLSKTAQIGCDDEPLELYDIKEGCTTGRTIRVRIGDLVEIVFRPNEIDAGGSLLVRFCNDDGEKDNSKEPNATFLCDPLALELPSSSRLDQFNSDMNVHQKSNRLWMEGVKLWFTGELICAMDLFRQSLECFRWNEEASSLCVVGGIESLEDLECAASKPSPFRRDPIRSEVARRCLFLGMCLTDYQNLPLARLYLTRSLQTKLSTDPSPHAFRELMLIFDEIQNTQCARRVAKWSIEQIVPYWKNKYQRPGFMIEFEEEEYPNEYWSKMEEGYPAWCHAIAEQYDVIKTEFMELLKSSHPPNFSNSSSSNGLPTHWPKVGDKQHRQSGHDDHKVVSSGDWREMLLFGSGTTSPSHIAPRTKRLLQTHASDEVLSLCEMGGGEVIFSILAPHTRIAPHCAATNIRLTAHLGLSVPSSSSKQTCAIRVGERWHTWKEGEMLVFDDSYEHEVVNETDECRAVLLIRFWHPGVRKSQRQDVMREILRQKELTEKMRFVPPFLEGYEEVEKRGLGKTVCKRCLRSGEVKMVTEKGDGGGERMDDLVFVCSCGEPIA